jgi:hypothetical protein
MDVSAFNSLIAIYVATTYFIVVNLQTRPLLVYPLPPLGGYRPISWVMLYTPNINIIFLSTDYKVNIKYIKRNLLVIPLYSYYGVSITFIIKYNIYRYKI